MSASDAYCTLRILPRIGSSAWNSELRAVFAVPSAESPSTMNSSLRSSADRQSTSLAGSEELARADLRRWLSRCSRAAMRALAAEHLRGLPLELRFGHPDRDHRDQALLRILLGHGLVAVLQQPGRPERL